MSNSDMPSVNLFILGAAKCGTTFLHYVLQQHPDVFMSTPKEPLFFEAEYEKGCQYYVSRYYKGWSGERIVGEARHRNLYFPFVPGRIKKLYPDSWFVLIARHPVDRAYSHWWHWFSRGVEKKSFPEVLEDNFLRLEHGPFFETDMEIELYRETLDIGTGYSPYPSYIDSGYYAEQVKRYVKEFGRDRIHIIVFDNLINNPNNVLENLHQFLGVSCQYQEDFKPQNKAIGPIGVKTIRLLRKMPGKKLVPSNLRRHLNYGIRSFFNTGNAMPPMNPKLRSELLVHFESHIEEFEALIGRKLPEWRR